jgi:hypothetical protein
VGRHLFDAGILEVKLLILGVWITIVALGSAYGAAVYLPAMMAPKPTAAAVLQLQKTRVLNVPMIANGVVQGFMAMQFAYTIDDATLKALHVPPEVYLLDEAFRTVYSDNTLDFHKLEKYDLAKFTAHLVEATNTHLGAPLIKDVLIEQFSYISRDTMDR